MGGPVGLRLGGRDYSQVGGVGLADRDEARVAKARAEEGVNRQPEVGLLEALHPHVERLTGEAGAEVLEEERNPAEGAIGQLAAGGLEALLVQRMDDGVELGIEPLRALDRR